MKTMLATVFTKAMVRVIRQNIKDKALFMSVVRLPSKGFRTAIRRMSK